MTLERQQLDTLSSQLSALESFVSPETTKSTQNALGDLRSDIGSENANADKLRFLSWELGWLLDKISQQQNSELQNAETRNSESQSFEWDNTESQNTTSEKSQEQKNISWDLHALKDQIITWLKLSHRNLQINTWEIIKVWDEYMLNTRPQSVERVASLIKNSSQDTGILANIIQTIWRYT